MNKLKLIVTSLLMASMLTTPSFSMQAPGQASDDLVIDQTYGSTLTCIFPNLPKSFSYEASKRKGPQIELTSLTTEVKAPEIALQQFVAGMTTAELKAFNAAKATYSMTNDISDTYHDTKNPAEKLAIYTKWLDAYRAAQANA